MHRSSFKRRGGWVCHCWKTSSGFKTDCLLNCSVYFREFKSTRLVAEMGTWIGEGLSGSATTAAAASSAVVYWVAADEGVLGRGGGLVVRPRLVVIAAGHWALG
jgi:hypothetical protein